MEVSSARISADLELEEEEEESSPRAYSGRGSELDNEAHRPFASDGGGGRHAGRQESRGSGSRGRRGQRRSGGEERRGEERRREDRIG
eukprot:201126-Hanusia_phi.AAC.1